MDMLACLPTAKVEVELIEVVLVLVIVEEEDGAT